MSAITKICILRGQKWLRTQGEYSGVRALYLPKYARRVSSKKATTSCSTGVFLSLWCDYGSNKSNMSLIPVFLQVVEGKALSKAPKTLLDISDQLADRGSTLGFVWGMSWLD